MSNFRFFLAVVIALFTSTAARSQWADGTPGNLVANGSMSFTDPSSAPLLSGGMYYAGADPTALSGWTFLNSGPSAEFWVAFQNQASPDGGQYLGIQDLTSYAPRNNVLGITQTISGLTVGVSYDLSFYSMSNHDGSGQQDWQVSFGSATQTGLPTQPNADDTGNWVLNSMAFTATSATQALTFVAQYLPGSVPEMLNLDGVVLTQAPVPEPPIAALLIAGLAAICIGARHQRLRRQAPPGATA